jgi:integrase
LRLGGRHSLVKAVDWFLRTYRDTLTEKTLTEAYPLFLADRLPHLRAPTYHDYKTTLTSFATSFGRKRLPDIMTEDVITFLRARTMSGKSWNNLRADLNTFFVWAAKAPRKWISENPVKDVEKFKTAQGLPEILTAPQVKALFEFLETYRGNARRPMEAGFMVPYFALATFAGIRPSINGGEITRIAKLENRDRIIDLKIGVIRITPDLAKTKDVRQVVIQPNLATWLTRYPLDRFPILPRNAFDYLQEIRKKFSIGHDVLRHTFISMHVAKFRSMGDAALQAGNSEHMIKKHYFNLVTREEADEFWGIMPSTALAVKPATSGDATP